MSSTEGIVPPVIGPAPLAARRPASESILGTWFLSDASDGGGAAYQCTLQAGAHAWISGSGSAAAAAASAAAALADRLLCDADVVLTHADVVLTHADVVSTGINATTATTQAGIATTQAGNAAASAATATTQAATATTQAGNASASAATATTQAATATTQAGIATTQATNAAASAAAAALSATLAELNIFFFSAGPTFTPGAALSGILTVTGTVRTLGGAIPALEVPVDFWTDFGAECGTVTATLGVSGANLAAQAGPSNLVQRGTVLTDAGGNFQVILTAAASSTVSPVKTSFAVGTYLRSDNTVYP